MKSTPCKEQNGVVNNGVVERPVGDRLVRWAVKGYPDEERPCAEVTKEEAKEKPK